MRGPYEGEREKMAEVEWSGESSRRREGGGCGFAEELEDPGLWRSGAGSGSGSVLLPSAPLLYVPR